MKLIPEELIEETANSRAEKLFSDNCGGEYTAYELKFMCKNDFIAGERFAEERLAPLFVEFAEWASYNYTSSDGVHCKIGSNGIDNWITSQQLFEEFINTKKQNL